MLHHHIVTGLVVGIGLACFSVSQACAVEIKQPASDKIMDDQDHSKLILKGKMLAQQHCSGCHAIGKTGDSPRKECPPFRTLHKKWPVETLEESLAEGIMTGHNDMPEIRMSAQQITAFIAFLKSLEEEG